jgi:hypothetical protein
MAHFGYQRKLVEGPAQANEEVLVLGGEAEGPGELHEKRPELPAAKKGKDSLFKARHLSVVQYALVCESLV